MPVVADVQRTVLFCLATTLLLAFVSISVPVWDQISFLNVEVEKNSFSLTIKYGVFGFSGSPAQIGYTFPGQVANGPIFNDLTKTLILHPVGAGLSTISVLLSLCGASYSRVGSMVLTLFVALAAITTAIVWIIDMILFTLVRDHFNKEGVSAHYGNGLWLTFAALVVLLVELCTYVSEMCATSRRDSSRMTSYTWWRNNKFRLPTSEFRRTTAADALDV